jgi:glyoxylate reductase
MSRPRVMITRPIPDAAVMLLREVADVVVPDDDRPLTPDELRAAVPGARAVVAMLHDRIDESVLSAAGDELAVVANVAVGFENIDLPACERHGVVVTNTPDVLTDATADLTIALMLAVTRRVAEGDRLLRAGTPWAWSMSFMLGSGLHGRRLGIVGYGRIGQAVARRAAAFGMEIAYSSPRAIDAPDEPVAPRLALADLLARSDVISLHCPLSPETRHLIDAAALQSMQPSAYLINTARGSVVDEEALVVALGNGTIRGAALDVFENEPSVHPGLLQLDNVVLTPHLGSATAETRRAMAVLAARNVAEVLAGRPPLSRVAVAPHTRPGQVNRLRSMRPS